jgi:hypothetical protein
MKKILVLTLCLSFILILVGCNSDKKVTTTIQTTNENQTLEDNPKDTNTPAANEQNSVDENKETDTNTNSPKTNPKGQVVKDKNNASQRITKVNRKINLYNGTYLDESYLGHDISKLETYCEVVISNVTNTSFDFTVYEVDRDTESKKVIFLTNTAVFTGNGLTATFYGHDYTLNFTFPNIMDIKISGFKPLEGKTYINTGIPGLKLYEGTYWDERGLDDNILNFKNYCEVVISNVTNTSFDFTVYEVDRQTENRKVIFLTNTAVFTADGKSAAFYGKNYTLNFTFPSITEIKVSGFKPLEGKTYLNNKIQGHECS